MKRTLATLVALLLAVTVAGCASSARFGTPPRAEAPRLDRQAPPLGGPYTREREDREFGQQAR
jgi:hypothetical protein